MINKELAWKEFNVDLEAFEASLKASLGTKIIGTSADSNFRVHMTDDATQEDQDSVQATWDTIDAESDMAKSYRSQEQIASCIQSMKDGIPAKTWNQLTAPERKVVLGMTPTKAELIAASLL